MANQRREPVGYQPFRTRAVLSEGLLPVARAGGEFMDKVAGAMFRLAEQAGVVADRQAEAAGRRAGQQAALDGRPNAAVNGGASGGVASEGGNPLTGSRAEKAAKAKAYLMQKHGVSNEFASGLVGQFAQESGFNTRALNRGDGNDGSDSVGMGQWNGKRARALRQFAADQGRPWDDFELQLDFAMHELSTSEKAVGNRLRAARSVEEATAAAIGYERPQGWTPQNPRGGHGWANRLAAAQSVYGAASVAPAGVDATPTASVPGSPAVAVNGGTFRPTGRDTIYGRAYDEAGTRTYVQMLETEMRSTSSQLFDRYKDDPVKLAEAFNDLKGVIAKEHVFPEIMAEYEVGFGNLAERYVGQARENLARKVEAQDRADFIERTGVLETEQKKRLADFDPASPDAADAIASSQAAIDDHYDAAVKRGILDPDDAAKAKIASRREAALGFYGKQADALDADGVGKMRKEMTKDFAAGELEGLDGDGWQTLDRELQRLETAKRNEAKREANDFRQRGDQMAARIAAGFEVDPAELSKYMLDAGTTPEGKAALQESLAKISAGRAIRDMNVRQGDAHVAGLRKQYGKEPTDGQLRILAFAEGMLDKKKRAIATDPVSYAEAQNIVPATPLLTDAQSIDDMQSTMSRRMESAMDAAAELGITPRYLKAGEAKAVAAAVKADPAAGASISAAIVAGAGDKAANVLAEFGADAPMIAESGAIIASGGSASAAQDVITGYGKGADGKQLKGLKPATERENAMSVAGSALAYAPKDFQRIQRAAGAIARTRVSEQNLDPTSDEAIEVYRQAMQEAAGAVFDRGEQYGGFADFGGGLFTSASKVMIPSAIRADLFEDVVGAITDHDLSALAVKPRAGLDYVGGRGGGHRVPRGLAASLRGAVPVAVDGGFAFAFGDPGSEDPQFVQGDNGDVFVLDIMALRDRLAPRVPGAFR